MLGSTNYVPFVYDGDGSVDGVSGPNGSGTIESVFTDYLASRGGSEPTAFDGHSDYGAFIAAGIPAGGLFSGAEGLKTDEEAEKYRGAAGVAYDECYHSECDDIDNINPDGLDLLADAAAHATYVFAQTQSAVNGTGKEQGHWQGRPRRAQAPPLISTLRRKARPLGCLQRVVATRRCCKARQVAPRYARLGFPSRAFCVVGCSSGARPQAGPRG